MRARQRHERCVECVSFFIRGLFAHATCPCRPGSLARSSTSLSTVAVTDSPSIGFLHLFVCLLVCSMVGFCLNFVFLRTLSGFPKSVKTATARLERGLRGQNCHAVRDLSPEQTCVSCCPPVRNIRFRLQHMHVWWCDHSEQRDVCDQIQGGTHHSLLY